ncbi:glutamine-hydrolyzing carbamoyl-phosphate synthase small subunit [Dissulfurirhabdus thermomarina]|uniref:Carbamoyl phosphate synthase small chain n=1 Tax=Dissulfurirhabdus thermomarina TaxID=1765737 RepID=A0A6N9TLE0_DISTH|nr:glutamine-hydrolyzing carbamoyl-phosphate synthase small subunit [Dissulfurirhabdus thermomarina]NDY42045.1 glutamine-hydrolyzing carbamoyl-phosphate synthase small subunit [Dissulfurirhabdus thermomarina]NMX22337.1 glutamine-hydrolyzing carbamoyl-phosphate synthase small subunit [Dissulfurirhabdus thermomarina]
MKALIALEDGRLFEGRAFAGSGETEGEIVFNTSMTGYQEILTDPSYKGQIVTLTYPLVGNYGVTPEDDESEGVHVQAFVVREYEDAYSNWRARASLRDYLEAHGVLGVEQVDTRAITRHIRRAGAMRAVVSTVDLDPGSLVAKARRSPGLEGRDLVREVTCRRPYEWHGGRAVEPGGAGREEGLTVAVLDCGLKRNQLRLLEARGCRPRVFPAGTPPEDLLAAEPDGIFVSNGPGDPAALTGVVRTVRALLGRRPVFGICLGHQILGQALGGRTYKLKFGHRGGNQPVKNLRTGRVEITSQNHGFAVDADSLPAEVEVTHVNLNDQTVEGIRHPSLAAFSVQYHPENAPGPHDAEYLFDDFVALMREVPKG